MRLQVAGLGCSSASDCAQQSRSCYRRVLVGRLVSLDSRWQSLDLYSCCPQLRSTQADQQPCSGICGAGPDADASPHCAPLQGSGATATFGQLLQWMAARVEQVGVPLRAEGGTDGRVLGIRPAWAVPSSWVLLGTGCTEVVLSGWCVQGLCPRGRGDAGCVPWGRRVQVKCPQQGARRGWTRCVWCCSGGGRPVRGCPLRP